MKISLRQFGGIAPRMDPRTLPEGAAQTAENCKLWNGSLVPWKGPGALITDGTDSPKVLYRMGQNESANGDTQYWWTIPYEANVARGPVFDDADETTYFTYKNGSTYYQRVTNKTQGTSAMPSSWSMSVPAPTVAPTVTVQGTGDTKEDAVDRLYVYTYVNSVGFESAPSPASSIVTLRQNGSNSSTHYARLVVTEPPSDAEYRFAVSGAEIRIYCGDSAEVYTLVGILTYNGSAWAATSGVTGLSDLGTTLQVDDKVLGSERAGALETSDWLEPPSDLHGLVAMPNGILAGISKNNICFCDPYHTQAWPLANRHALEYQPIALGVFGNTCVVGTNGVPFVVSGTEPTAMVPQKIERNQACVSASSMVSLGGGVAYASPDGLCVVDGSGLNLVSEKYYSRDDWQALNPGTIRATAWDGRYVMSCDPDGNGTYTVGIVWDFLSGPTTLNMGDINALYADLLSDKLYWANASGHVFRFDYDPDQADRLTYTWKSKMYEHPQPVNYGCAQVHADLYDNGTTQDLTLKIYADGVLKHTQAVTSRLPFRLPSGFKAREWEIEVVGNVRVFGIDVASVMTELMNG